MKNQNVEENTKEINAPPLVENYRESLIVALGDLIENDRSGVITANTILHKLKNGEL